MAKRTEDIQVDDRIAVLPHELSPVVREVIDVLAILNAARVAVVRGHLSGHEK